MITLVNYILEKNILVTNITLRTACAVLLLQTDGRADHNPQHVAVQAAALALVLLLDLDMAVLIRTVAGHSWANYVKRTMSIFNMEMNGTSLARPSMDERNESIMARCNGLGDIRAAGAESSDFKDAVLSSVGAVINLLANRFKKCELRQIDSPSSDDIDILQSAILQIDKTLDLEKLTKKGVEKCADW